MAISQPRALWFFIAKKRREKKNCWRLRNCRRLRDLLLITSRRFGIFQPFKVKAKPEDASASASGIGQLAIKSAAASSSCELRNFRSVFCCCCFCGRFTLQNVSKRQKRFFYTYSTILFMNCWIFHAFPSCCCCCCCCGALGHNKSVKTRPDIAVWPFIDRRLGQLVCVIIIKYKSVFCFFLFFSYSLLNVRLFFVDFAISVEQIKNKQTSVNCQKISLKTKLPQPLPVLVSVSEPGLKPCLLASLAGCLAVLACYWLTLLLCIFVGALSLLIIAFWHCDILAWSPHQTLAQPSQVNRSRLRFRFRLG